MPEVGVSIRERMKAAFRAIREMEGLRLVVLVVRHRVLAEVVEQLLPPRLMGLPQPAQ